MATAVDALPRLPGWSARADCSTEPPSVSPDSDFEMAQPLATDPASAGDLTALACLTRTFEREDYPESAESHSPRPGSQHGTPLASLNAADQGNKLNFLDAVSQLRQHAPMPEPRIEPLAVDSNGNSLIAFVSGAENAPPDDAPLPLVMPSRHRDGQAQPSAG